MAVIIIGILAFLIGITFDFISARRLRLLKPIAWTILCVLLGYAHIAAAFDPAKIARPTAAGLFGWPIFALGVFLMVYSLFLEIPFSNTYVRATPGNRVTRVGTYALTRHPAVLWYALVLLGLFLLSGSRLLAAAAPVWLAMDVIWVWVEDRFVFERMFEDYEDYRKATPMLVPTRASIASSWQTLPLRHLVAGSGRVTSQE